MPRGGARLGAGRKPNPDKKKAATGFSAGGKKTKDAPENWPFGTAEPAAPAPDAGRPAEEIIPGGEPLVFLQAVIDRVDLPLATRMQAAAIAVSYKHAKPAQMGKKGAKGEAAKEAGTGKFGSTPPPLRAVK